jgi:hypothetical protein
VEDLNIAHDVLDKFSIFKIFVVWELDFIKIIRMLKNLNKDCNLSTKLSYCKSLSHAH